MARQFPFAGTILRTQALNILAAALNQGSTLAANFLLAKTLTANDFGAFSIVQISVTILAAATQLSAWFTAAHFCGRYRDHDPVRLGAIIRVLRVLVVSSTGLASIVLMLLHDVYAVSVLKHPELATEVHAAALFVVFAGYNSHQIGVLVGMRELDRYAISSIVQSAASIALIAGLGYAYGSVGALVGSTISSGLRCVLTATLVSHALTAASIRVQAGPGKVLQEILAFAAPATASAWSNVAALWGTAILVVQDTDGLARSAMYAICLNLRTLALFLPQQANAASIGHLSSVLANEPRNFQRAFTLNLVAICGTATLTAGFVAVFALQILSLYGGAYETAEGLLRIMMLSVVIEVFGNGIMQRFSSSGSMWVAFWAGALPRDLVTLATLLAVMPWAGMESAGWGLVAGWTTYAVGLFSAHYILQLRRERFL